MASKIYAKPYSWSLRKKIDRSGRDLDEIVCFAKDVENQDVCLRFGGFQPFVFIELPKFVNKSIVNWSSLHVSTIFEWLRKTFRGEAPCNASLVHMRKLYYYHGTRKFPMMRLDFHSTGAMYKVCEFLKTHTHDIPDIGKNVKLFPRNHDIETIRKFLTQCDIKYCQWFEVDVREVVEEECISTKAVEVYGQFQSIRGLTDEEEKKMPTVRLRVLSVDIEQYSKNPDKFPNATLSSDIVYMVSLVYQESGAKETRKNIIVTCLPCKSRKKGNVEIIHVANEQAVLDKLEELILELDPDIMTGYNVMTYDWPVMDQRKKRKNKDWINLSKLKVYLETAFASRKWKSSAYGHVNFVYPNTPGRLDIDMLPLIKRDHKLPKYDLNTVSKKFLNRTKLDMPAKEMFRIVKAAQQAERNGDFALIERLFDFNRYQELWDNYDLKDKDRFEKIRSLIQEAVHPILNLRSTFDLKKRIEDLIDYCDRDSDLVMDLFDKLNVLFASFEFANVTGTGITDLYTRGQQTRVLSLLYDQAIRNDIVLDEVYIEKMPYEGGYVWAKPGLHENVFCFDFNSLYPSCAMAMNIDYTTFVPPEIGTDEIPDEDCNIIEWDQEVDESSLRYRAENPEDGDVEGFIDAQWSKDPNVRIEDDEDDIVLDGEEPKEKKGKTKTAHFRFRFVKREIQEGLIPSLARGLIAERKAVRREIAKIEEEEFQRGVTPEQREEYEVLGLELEGADKRRTYEIKARRAKIREDAIEAGETFESKCMKGILDQRQLSIKVTTNSLYGFLGAQEAGRRPFIYGALCITAFGRQCIKKTNEYLERVHGGEIVYNDTDSAMAKLDGLWEREDEIQEVGAAMAKELSSLFPADLNLDHEKFAKKMLVIKPKMYIFCGVGDDGRVKMQYENVPIQEEVEYTDTLGRVHTKLVDTGETQKRIKLDEYGNACYSWLIKGLLPARRDGTGWSVNLFNNVARSIINGRTLQETSRVIEEDCLKMLRRQVHWKELTTIRQLGANYKSPSYPLKIFADQLREQGIPVQAGERLEFLIAKTAEKVLQGYKMRLTEQYLSSLESENPIQIDYSHYILKMNDRIKTLLETAYGDQLKLPAHESRRGKKGKVDGRVVGNNIKGFLKVVEAKNKFLEEIKEWKDWWIPEIST